MKNRSTNTNKKRVRPEPKQEPLISSLSEAQQISMGYRNPRVTTPSFVKNEQDRKDWKKVHTNAKGPTSPSAPGTKRNEPEMNLIVHVWPTEASPKTTHSFKAKRSEVGYILGILLAKESITKAYYGGKELDIAS